MEAGQQQQQPASSGNGGDSYEEDEFMDGEESTSKEVKRSAFDIESITEQRFTPGTNNLSQYQQRYTQPNVNASIEESSAPNDSGS